MKSTEIELSKEVLAKLKDDYFLKKAFVENHRTEIKRLNYIKQSIGNLINLNDVTASKIEYDKAVQQIEHLEKRVNKITVNCGALLKLKNVEDVRC